ncbi:hypothetical protein DFJ73DRAFT_836016 [Zopfochytrium polystomum]|nr:hypothetical protein DFJ73DRAFT_836016 [Zopfochytrium polystomum]
MGDSDNSAAGAPAEEVPVLNPPDTKTEAVHSHQERDMPVPDPADSHVPQPAESNGSSHQVNESNQTAASATVEAARPDADVDMAAPDEGATTATPAAPTATKARLPRRASQQAPRHVESKSEEENEDDEEESGKDEPERDRQSPTVTTKKKKDGNTSGNESIGSESREKGSVVWAKVKGFAWWPGRIEDESDIPDHVLKVKPISTKTHPVFFFGSHDYSWCGPDMIKPFKENYDLLSKKNKTVAFLKGLREALDPTQSLDIPEEPPKKKKAAGRRKSAPPTGKTDEEEAYEGEGDGGDDEDFEEKPTKQKGRQKKRRMSEPASGEPKSKKKKSAEFIAPEDEDEEEDAPEEHDDDSKEKKTKTPEEKLKKLRSKLQRFLQTEHTEADHFIKADKHMSEVEAFEVDVDLLMKTKIGRVMKKISRMELPKDEFNLVTRSLEMIEKWKSVI